MTPEFLTPPENIEGPWLLAISGGRDSMVLLHLFCQYFPKSDIRVATVDHGLHPEGAQWATMVQNAAHSLSVESKILKVPGAPPSNNTEEWARDQRYHVLAETARSWQCPTLVTAHHGQDQAETVLWRMLRGSGLQGLAGMPLVQNLHGLKLWRPCLPLTPEALHGMAPEVQALYQDPMNQDQHFLRARLRERWPDLERMAGRPITKVLMRMASHLAQDFADLEASDDPFYQKALANNPAVLDLSACPAHRHHRLLRRFLKSKKYPTRHEGLRRLQDSLDHSSWAEVPLGLGNSVFVKDQKVCLEKVTLKKSEL